MLLLVLQKDGTERFAGIQLRLTLHQIRTLTLAAPFADDSTEECDEQDADCLFCTGLFSKATMEKSGYGVRNVSDGRTHCLLI